MPPPHIRPAHADELDALREIERRAGQAYRSVGMADVAADEPMALEQLETFRADGRAWVAVAGDALAGYVLVAEIDAGAHVQQVAVDPAFSRRGIGRELIDAVERWAQARGLAAVTLTTFAEVPWNAPYYERLGFEAVVEPAGDLAAFRRTEATVGLDRWPRVAMARAVRPVSSECVRSLPARRGHRPR